MAFGRHVTDNTFFFAFGISASLLKFFETWKLSLKLFIVFLSPLGKFCPDMNRIYRLRFSDVVSKDIRRVALLNKEKILPSVFCV